MTRHCIINALEKFIYSIPLVYFNKHCFGTVCLPIYVYETVNIIYMQTKIWYNIANAESACQMILSRKNETVPQLRNWAYSSLLAAQNLRRHAEIHLMPFFMHQMNKKWMNKVLLTAIYHAKANRFLVSQGKKKKKKNNTWDFWIVEELDLLFIYKTEDATKIPNGHKCSAAVMQWQKL